MRRWNILGPIVCGVLLSTTGAADAHHHDEGLKISFSDLVDKPDQYLGKTVTFEANVDEIVGPNIIRIESPGTFNWFGGNTLAYAPDVLGVAVSDGDRVMITGVAEQFDRGRMAPYLNWIDPSLDFDESTRERPVVRITHIYAEDSRDALVRSTGQGLSAVPGAPNQPVGITGQADTCAVGTTGTVEPPFTHVDQVFEAERKDAGRTVNLQRMRVARVLSRDFFVAEYDGRQMLLKMPAEVDPATVRVGQVYDLEGIVMQMPDTRFIPGTDAQQAARLAERDVYLLVTRIHGLGAQPAPTTGVSPGATPDRTSGCFPTGHQP